MKKIFIAALAASLIGAILIVGTAYAAPNTVFSWTAPTNYEDGSVLDPILDPLTYTIYCGTQQGGPYNITFDAGVNVETNTIDVGACVNGIPGTYYFVATALSSSFNTESANSGELAKVYTAADLGKVPNAPVLISVQ